MPIDPLLVSQVRWNCTISDAQFAGMYSVCGLAMRLRDLYKWEHGLEPYEEHDAPRVLEWIGRKETEWESVQDAEFNNLSVDGQSIDPFDTEKINALLAPKHFFYGAGYAQSLKPSFLLARIHHQKSINGHAVIYLGAEMARDLLTLPALIQDHTILVRQTAVQLYVWDQMLYLTQSGRDFFEFALAECGISNNDTASLKDGLPQVVAAQQNTFLFHEIGELTDPSFDTAIWRDLIATLPHTPAELLARTVKDILADTNPEGTLHQIVRSQHRAGLGFYAAFLDGLGKKLFPEIRSAIHGFIQDGRWEAVAAMTKDVHQKAETMAHMIGRVYLEGSKNRDPEWIVAELSRRFIDPLTNPMR